mgnify:CR=1 FL=1
MGSMPALGFLPPELNKAGLSRVGRDWKHKVLHHVKALECFQSAITHFWRIEGTIHPSITLFTVPSIPPYKYFVLPAKG